MPIWPRNILAGLAREYRQRWGIGLLACGREGRIALRLGPSSPAAPVPLLRTRARAIEEALRWGEATAQLDHGVLLWAVPLMTNAQVTGGLVAGVPEERILPPSRLDSRAAGEDLRALAERANLTNAAYLKARREEYQREQDRAEAIHTYKSLPPASLHQMYLLDEPALLAAIRRGDRREARAVLNRLLVAIHHHAGQRFGLIKSFFMELVATMSRLAVEAGGSPEQLLGANFASIGELARIQSDERLAPWLHRVLEHIMDSIQVRSASAPSLLVAAARRHMAEHLADDLSRQDVAGAVHLSPAHFSRLFHRVSGKTFTAALNELRIQRAMELLLRSDQAMAQIALACGFQDQSYFTKVFRRHTGTTPQRYRRRGEGGSGT